ncbi:MULTISPECIES: hypothetical protein [Sphingobium]|uniref:hypothetical protein n=1 Tax=Sphingobium sp. MI1205 TaxID=407020 RepID=UPI000AABCBE8|nr:hypothetical protein [Sphingobium sp. MI1205]
MLLFCLIAEAHLHHREGLKPFRPQLPVLPTGRLSPLPQHTYALMTQSHRAATGLAQALVVVTAELWLMLAPAMIVLRFADPVRRASIHGLIPLTCSSALLFWRSSCSSGTRA